MSVYALARKGPVVVILRGGRPEERHLVRYAHVYATTLRTRFVAVYVPRQDGPAKRDAFAPGLLSWIEKQGGSMVALPVKSGLTHTLNRVKEMSPVLVVMAPDRLAWWEYLVGRSPLHEAIARELPGKGVVLFTGRIEESEQVAREQLSSFLPEKNVRLYDQPVGRDGLLLELLHGVVDDKSGLEVTPLHAALLQREEEFSTFLDEGLGLPHLRVPHLDHPRIAVALTRKGVLGVETREPVRLVWLLLLPEEPTPGFMPVNLVTKMFMDAPTRKAMIEAANGAAFLTVLQAWETKSGG